MLVAKWGKRYQNLLSRHGIELWTPSLHHLGLFHSHCAIGSERADCSKCHAGEWVVIGLNILYIALITDQINPTEIRSGVKQIYVCTSVK